MYCSNCGEKIDEDDLFCPRCGAKRKVENKNLESTQSKSDTKTNEIPSEEIYQKSGGDYVAKAILIVVGIFLVSIAGSSLFGLLFGSPSDINEPDSLDIQQSSNQYTSKTYELTQEEINIQTCEQIAKEYYESHTYAADDVFDCDNMAQDVWNMLKTKGINAKIIIGNTELGAASVMKN